MSLFTIEQALQPQGGQVSQLFMIFTDAHERHDKQAGYQEVIQAIAKTFPSAAIVLASPGEKLTHYESLVEHHSLSDEQIKSFVQQHQQDLQGLIKTFQSHLQIDSAATAVIGIGQIGSLVLELTKLAEPLAGRVITFGSRYAELPTEKLSLDQTIHLLHAGQDKLIPFAHAVSAQQTIAALEGDATIDVAHQIEHSFSTLLIEQMMQRLLSCVPLRYWKEAQESALSPDPASKQDSIH
ncbi:hydrolase [Pelistega indica]|uniref:Hydrolase n=1 Tax=Pelistega indica TaxID=1414851 RepID=V8FWQ8_9BURK|nr:MULTISPECIES: dienelactone hydrolase family protein [Pelistega]ETD68709.1 hydrolase [Pelistega indica]